MPVCRRCLALGSGALVGVAAGAAFRPPLAALAFVVPAIVDALVEKWLLGKHRPAVLLIGNLMAGIVIAAFAVELVRTAEAFLVLAAVGAARILARVPGPRRRRLRALTSGPQELPS